MKIGAHYLGQNQCEFTLYAPLKQSVALTLLSDRSLSEQPRSIPMQRDARGYWRVQQTASPGAQYQFCVDGTHQPDPASHYQPQGVHQASEVVDHRAFLWTDQNWSGVPLAQLVIYELHIGTFTPEGTFEAVIPRLAVLKALGVTAIEIMPVAQFPGDRNWGYDGTFPFAVQHSYGGPQGLKQLVNACHQTGIAVILDVVYNHLGPEGNYLWGLETYFTDKYRTPWGSAVNFDDAYSDGTRAYFAENVRYWLEDYHLDALRLDAVHAIYDFGGKHILQELVEVSEQVSQGSWPRFLIAESDLNDSRVIRPRDQGGYGVHAQWSDDFHHALHTLVTQESQGYYQDFGQIDHLVKVLRESFVYTWNYSPYRCRYHGNSAIDLPGEQFVVCAQNHDQVGNRMLGDRLSHLVSFEALKLVAGTLLLSPYVPMLFMGEEYGETAPFLYFVSHGDPDLVEAVRQGRKAEFAAFHAQGEAPDPQSPETFARSRLNWDLRHQGQHQVLWQFHQRLLQLRRDIPALASLDKTSLHVSIQPDTQLIRLHRWQGHSQVLCLLSFDQAACLTIADLPSLSATALGQPWQKILDSADPQWQGPGSNLPDRLLPQPVKPIPVCPYSVAVYQLQGEA